MGPVPPSISAKLWENAAASIIGPARLSCSTSQVAPAETLGPAQKSRYLAKLKSRNTSLGFLEEACGLSLCQELQTQQRTPHGYTGRVQPTPVISPSRNTKSRRSPPPSFANCASRERTSVGCLLKRRSCCKGSNPAIGPGRSRSEPWTAIGKFTAIPTTNSRAKSLNRPNGSIFGWARPEINHRRRSAGAN